MEELRLMLKIERSAQLISRTWRKWKPEKTKDVPRESIAAVAAPMGNLALTLQGDPIEDEGKRDDAFPQRQLTVKKVHYAPIISTVESSGLLSSLGSP